MCVILNDSSQFSDVRKWGTNLLPARKLDPGSKKFTLHGSEVMLHFG